MSRMTRSITVSSCLIILAVSAMFAYQAGARGVAAPRPATIATVDLTRVLEGLEERGSAEAALRTMSDGIRAELEGWEKELEELKTRLLGLQNDPAAAAPVDEELALSTLRFQAWQQFKRNEMDIEQALLMQDLYQKIRVAIRELAETQGYDLILVDDSQGELGWDKESRMSREAQVRQQIAARRVMYASPSIDATDDLVARMNNAYRTGGGITP